MMALFFAPGAVRRWWQKRIEAHAADLQAQLAEARGDLAAVRAELAATQTELRNRIASHEVTIGVVIKERDHWREAGARLNGEWQQTYGWMEDQLARYKVLFGHAVAKGGSDYLNAAKARLQAYLEASLAVPPAKVTQDASGFTVLDGEPPVLPPLPAEADAVPLPSSEVQA